MTTATQTLSSPATKSRRDALRDKLSSLGLSEAEIKDTLSLIAPKPRAMDPNKPIPSSMLVQAGQAIVDGTLAEWAGVEASTVLYGQRAKLDQRIDGDATKILDILARMEAAMAEPAKRTTVLKNGNTRPSNAWLALIRLKGILAKAEG